MRLYEQRTFIDEETGNCVYEMRSPDRPDQMPLPRKFYAMASHTLTRSDGAQIPDQFRIDIEAGSVEEAFEKLPLLLPAMREKRIEELNKFAADQQRKAASSIVMPNGQPVMVGKPKTRLA